MVAVGVAVAVVVAVGVGVVVVVGVAVWVAVVVGVGFAVVVAVGVGVVKINTPPASAGLERFMNIDTVQQNIISAAHVLALKKQGISYETLRLLKKKPYKKRHIQAKIIHQIINDFSQNDSYQHAYFL